MTPAEGPACSACGGDLPSGARFCPTCGVVVGGQPSGEERRLVSVLFADIEGFTTLSEHRDPESVKVLLDECFDDLVPVVAAHGGHVDKIIGDEIMAVFGAPTAHEDDAERAVRAGMALVETLAQRRPELGLRVGINTGEVLAGTVGPNAGYTVTGDVVNTAHRLAGATVPGEVLVAERTRQACVASIGFRSRQVLELKGKNEPVEAWVADRLLTASVDRDDRLPRMPLVGRQGELDGLHRRVLDAFGRRRSELVVMVGEPGVGKTRLAVELSERLDARPSTGRVIWATCSPYGSEGDLSPLVEIIRSGLELARNADTDTQREQLRGRLSALGLTDPSIARRLADLLGLGRSATGPVDAETTGRNHPSEHHIAAVVAVLAAMARSTPLLLIVDDVHWAEKRVVRFLRRVPELLPDLPLVVVALGRDDLLERHRPLLGGNRVTTRTLDPLGDDASVKLILSVLGEFDPDGRVGPDALDRLVRAAGGNPLLTEQLVLFLIESGRLAPRNRRWRLDSTDGAVEVVLPDGIRSLIGARLDALAPDERSLLADASVFGRVFWLSALLESRPEEPGEVEATMRRLADRGLVEPDPGGDREMWRFRHSLTRDVAYAGISLADRAERHALVARWIERRFADRTDPSATAAIAHHYERAVALGRAVDQVDATIVRPAFSAIIRAARDEQRREGMRRADRWYRLARSVSSPDPDEMIEAVAEHGEVLLGLGQLDEAQDAFEELARRAGSARPPMAAFAEAHLGAVARLQGDVDLARERFLAAVNRWRELEDLQGVADALRLEGWAEFTAGRPRAAVPRLERASAIELQLDEPVRRSDTLRYLGWCEYLDGRLIAAEDHLRTAMSDARDVGEEGTAAFCEGLLGHVLLRSGRANEALALARDLRVRASSGSDPWGEWSCATLEAAALLGLGSAAEACELGLQAVARFEELDDALGLGIARLVTAQALRALGEATRARTMIDRLLSAGRPEGVPAEDARALAELAALDLDDGALDDAERRARGSLALVRAGIGDDESGLKALRVLARVSRRRGQDDAAELLLDEAAAPRAPGDRSEGWRLAAVALAELRLDRGDRHAAESLIAAASDPPCDLVRVLGRLETLKERIAATE
ncbi:MAG: tetratricopeptide repeat protein [Acidimicrobiales bacterium]|nr:tetratricopeptide repeat protein [Acidimicrobiales bacterium]